MALLLQPRMEMVRDRHEIEAVVLGESGEFDQPSGWVLLARERESESGSRCRRHGCCSFPAERSRTSSSAARSQWNAVSSGSPFVRSARNWSNAIRTESEPDFSAIAA